MRFNPSEDLLSRLAAEDCAPEDVMEFLSGQYEEAVMTTPDEVTAVPEPEPFFNGQADLDSYAQARAWWPKDVPPQFACPSIFQLCSHYTEQDERIGATFMARLMIYTSKLQHWLQEEGRDPNNPDESAAQRKRRLNAEAQARHRARQQDGPEAEHARAVGAAYQAYLDVCAHRKEERKRLDAEVATARKAWKDLKATPPA